MTAPLVHTTRSPVPPKIAEPAARETGSLTANPAPEADINWTTGAYL